MTTLKQYLDSLTLLSEESWSKVESLFGEKSLSKGEYFIRAGQLARKIGFLQKGILRGYYTSDEGVEYNKHFFIAPCFIGGYASLITGTTNQINQQALSECDILEADFSQFSALYPNHPDVERVARVLAERFFVQKEQREIDIVLLDADQRYQCFQKEFGGLEQLIPQYHIASYLGITPTQLSRIRKKMAAR